MANVVIPTSDYVRFATHCGFPRLLPATDPQPKGIVGYDQRDLAVPLFTEAARSAQFLMNDCEQGFEARGSCLD